MAAPFASMPAARRRRAASTLANPGKLNAIDIAMWRELRALFDAPAGAAARRCAARGDRARRGRPVRLRRRHRRVRRASASTSTRCATSTRTSSRRRCRRCCDCDIPLVAQIEGACIGGGLEIAACCDIRICGAAQPLRRADRPARLPDGAGRAAGASPRGRRAGAARDAARGAPARRRRARCSTAWCTRVRARRRGGRRRAAPRAERIAALSPQAARINKRTLRQFAAGGPSAARARARTTPTPTAPSTAKA